MPRTILPLALLLALAGCSVPVHDPPTPCQDVQCLALCRSTHMDGIPTDCNAACCPDGGNAKPAGPMACR